MRDGSSNDGTKVKYLEDALRFWRVGQIPRNRFFPSAGGQVSPHSICRCFLVTEHVDNKSKVNLLAFWQGSDFGNPFEYSLAGTPCDDVIN